MSHRAIPVQDANQLTSTKCPYFPPYIPEQWDNANDRRFYDQSCTLLESPGSQSNANLTEVSENPIFLCL